MNIKEAFSIYTGGGIWLFYGSLEEGNYFFTDNDGFTLILNEDPSKDIDAVCYSEWQEDHTIRELFGKECQEFCMDLLGKIEGYSLDDHTHRNGFTNEDVRAYRKWMRIH